MNALVSAYADDSRSDGEEDGKSLAAEQKFAAHNSVLLPHPNAAPEEPGKKRKLQSIALAPSSTASEDVRRYVSKRECMAASVRINSPSRLGDEGTEVHFAADSLPGRIKHVLAQRDNGATPRPNCIPKKDIAFLEGHTRGVNCVRWSQPCGQLLASASMDHTVRIWNIWTDDDTSQCVRTIAGHNGAVKDVQWSPADPHLVLSGGFDSCMRLTDVETGHCVRTFITEDFVNALKFHPTEPHLFLSGGAKAVLRCWDVRSNDRKGTDESSSQMVRVLGGMGAQPRDRGPKVFPKLMGQVLDLDFHRDGKEFIATYDVARRNTLDKAVVVWGFDLGVMLSNQVYLEGYTCPCVRYHPTQETFIAQSNADYISVFSARAPYKRITYRRLQGHSVAGYRVQCNFSPDGELLVTGSADGSVHFYRYSTGKALRALQAHSMVSTDAVYHPLLPSIVATCSWDGVVSVFE